MNSTTWASGHQDCCGYKWGRVLRSTTIPIWHHSQGDQQFLGGRLIILGHLRHGRNSTWSFLEQVIILCIIPFIIKLLIIIIIVCA